MKREEINDKISDFYDMHIRETGFLTGNSMHQLVDLVVNVYNKGFEDGYNELSDKISFSY